MDVVDAAERQILLALLRSDIALSGRALGRVTGLTQSRAQRALVRLRERGLVLTEEAPPSLLYRANRDHLAMPAISELLSMPERLRDQAANEIAAWTVPPAAAVLYGSVARGDAGVGSDVDVLLVRPNPTRTDDPTWESQAARLGDSLRRWTGHPASVVELSTSELRRGLAEGEPYLVAAAAEGMLLYGRPLGHFVKRTG